MEGVLKPRSRRPCFNESGHGYGSSTGRCEAGRRALRYQNAVPLSDLPMGGADQAYYRALLVFHVGRSSIESCQYRSSCAAFLVLERLGKTVEVGIGHAERTSFVLPARDGLLDLRQHFLRA